MVAEPSSSWSFEDGCRRRRAESSRHAHETIVRSQDSRVVRTCWSMLVAAIIMITATVNFEKYRMLENERTMRTESQNAESQRSRVKSKGQVLEMAQSHGKR